MKLKQLLTGALLALSTSLAFAGTTINGVNGYSPATDVNPVPVEGTITTTPSGTQDTNTKQVNGSTVNVGTGAASTGTQRVTTSTDSTIGTVTTITNPVTVTDGAGALNVIVDSSALPSGASSSANQTSLQTPVAPATATATKGVLGGGQYNSTPVTATDGQQMGAQYDSHGSQKTCQVDTTGACVNPATPVSIVYSPAGTQITGSGTGASTSNVVATLSGASSLTTYISGFNVSCIGQATTSVNTTITVAGLVTASQTYQFTEAVTTLSQMNRIFSQPVPASATNTSITVTLNSIASGTTCSVNAEGFQL